MNYDELDRLIAALEGAISETNPQKGYWRDLWALVKEVGTGFKGTRYPTREEREKAWQRFQDLVAQANQRKEENQARIAQRQKDWERREAKSEAARDQIRAKAANARPLSDFERGLADLLLAPFKLVTAILLRLVGLETPSELEEIRNELLSCNAALQDAWRTFHQRKEDMLPGDRNQAYESLTQAREKLDYAWGQWKAAKSAIHERRQHEWEERQQAKAARRAEGERKRRAFVAHVTAHIATLEEKLDNARRGLDKQERHREELHAQYYGAWNEGFKTRCAGWIDEADTRITSIGEHIDRLEGWLREERRKLD